MRLRGRRHFPRRGPVLLIANHQSFFDPILPGSRRRHLCFLARQSLFENPCLVERFDSERRADSADGLASRACARIGVARAGRAVVVFPEGERTWDGTVQALQPGIQLLIKRVRRSFRWALRGFSRVAAFASVSLPRRCSCRRVRRLPAVGRPLDVEQVAAAPTAATRELYSALHEVHEEAESLRRKPCL